METAFSSSECSSNSSTCSRTCSSLQYLGTEFCEDEGQVECNSQGGWREQAAVEDPSSPIPAEVEQEASQVSGLPSFKTTFEWQRWLLAFVSTEVSKLSLGICLYHAMLTCPAQIGKYVREVRKAMPFQEGRQRDILPLPLPCVHMLDKWLLQQFQGNKHRQQKAKLAELACVEVWLWLIVVCLNFEYVGGHASTASRSAHNGLSLAQSACMFQLKEAVIYFAKEPLTAHKLPCFRSLVASKCNYNSDSVTVALPLKPLEILPGLPEEGVAGSVDALSLCAPDVQCWLADADASLLPQAEWPVRPPKAKVQASDADWDECAMLLYRRGICGICDISEAFHVEGQPVTVGAFGVEKKGTPLPGQSRITRVIINMIPTNSYQRMLRSDLSSLTPSSHWGGIALFNDYVLLWSGDDQKGAYYVFHLPECWKKYMVIGKPIRGSLVGLPTPWVWLYVRVIPMGWLSAVSLFQHIHRRLGFVGAKFPEGSEFRRDRKLPIPFNQPCRWVQYYLDDFDTPEVVVSYAAPLLLGTIPPWQQRQRQAYRGRGVRWAEEKSTHRQLMVERMGAVVDGEWGRVSVSSEKMVVAICFVLWLLAKVYIRGRSLLMVLGRLVRIFEFRRPLLGTLNFVWKLGPSTGFCRLSDVMVSELLVACCLVPLAFSDLRAKIDGMVTCSDASMAGGGTCSSSGLKTEAHRFLRTDKEGDSFRPLGAMGLGDEWPRVDLDVSCKSLSSLGQLRAPSYKFRILVVGLFDGIAGLLVAVSRLPVVVLGFATSEIDSAARKLVRKRWPGVIELGDICLISHLAIEKLASTYNAVIDAVIIAAGSPCQDLSALLSGGKGLQGERSRLFFEIPKVIKLFQQYFTVPVHYFVENVWSMTPDNRKEFSRVLGIVPYLVCASHFTHCKRPRLYWCTWPLFDQKNVFLLEHEDYIEVLPKVQKLPRQSWVTPGWEWPDGADSLPTFTRALPSCKPPRNPAGFEEASDLAKERWESDGYCFQVYQYEQIFMLHSADNGTMRLPSPEEREVLMGFDRNYTLAATHEKMPAREAFVIRCQLIGNSFCCSVVAFLLSHWLFHIKGIDYLLPPEVGLLINVAPETWSHTPHFIKGDGNTIEAQQLVWEYLRRAERGGSDVRLDLGIPYRAKAWPRAGIKSNLWTWQTVHGYPWEEGSSAHINHFELLAVLNAVRWRVRKASQVGSRFLHLVDNQVVSAILTKGRTSSLRLRHTLRRFNALLLAAGLFPAIGFLNSEDNPADVPSRWYKCRKRKSTA